ncbi:hypothetical protein G9U51_13170 [Calidifontibacter sp. DB0510]|uniref:Uncharacterized protein n=1 Tax=Metallococcus carri TaxID=1656884 RepID=A0A967EAY5_9MICO|nr:hypothetical protein [Metallococcus carri]NHN56730.1 hypothetical protein [Metallococcus carri]NOP37893.1 hypothetical protein [Calidifontibacter sp. DB2511S]
MSDDVLALRAAARSAGRLARDARHAAGLVAAADGVRWRSAGADQYRARLAEQRRDLLDRADTLDDLSGALLRHARQVEHNLSLVKSGLSVVAPVVGPSGVLW